MPVSPYRYDRKGQEYQTKRGAPASIMKIKISQSVPRKYYCAVVGFAQLRVSLRRDIDLPPNKVRNMFS